ncbi:diiron oxygenase [Burkholderia plantarii]|uniref:diiron oxygenase n=1 Tax=Burkholderia plantarii TaxID=41899 RepID=UPI0018DC80D7|nr:diiron oxygenase [Burkholderia plantarii]MBI0328597.1 diiron oxygenase [Burkholderia plantarii]
MNTDARSPELSLDDPVTRWYDNATVRNAPRILVPGDIGSEQIFPRSRQLVAEHQIVTSLGLEAVAYVLAQSTYKYMYEIGLLETRFVIDCALKIVNGEITPGASEEARREAITIVIDEGYHAYVALDFIIQMKKNSGIAPLSIPQTNGNLDAVGRGYARLPPELHGPYQLLATCLAEHTLTKDLLSIGREKEASRTFTQVMTDHVSDEGRHANYFARLVKEYWSGLDGAARRAIGVFLPAYLDDYLAADFDRQFDRAVLTQLSLTDAKIDAVLQDTQAAYVENARSYIDVTRRNLVKLLERTGVIDDDAVRAAFDAHDRQPA